MSKCKAIQCQRAAIEGHDFCPSCHINVPWGGFFSTDPIPTISPKPHPNKIGAYPPIQEHAILASFLQGVPEPTPTPTVGKSLAQQYPQYYKDVAYLSEVDVYAVHKLFDIQDPSGCIQHASKKLLLSGVRTGGKSVYDDIREARDTINRWLELNQSPKQPA